MYLQCKQGFIEADRWDGQRISIKEHQLVIDKLMRRKHGFVVVLRSREQSTLSELVGRIAPKRQVFQSPPGWDYEWRAYVTSTEWAQIMSTIVGDLDYRNFKNWCSANKPKDRQMAYDVWHAAHDAAHTQKGHGTQHLHWVRP